MTDGTDHTDETTRTSALLVIDVQNANTADGYQREAVIGRIRRLIDRAKSEEAPVIWVQHHAGGSPLKRGTDGWQIVEEVRPGDDETVIEKEYLDSFVETGLRAELDRARGRPPGAVRRRDRCLHPLDRAAVADRGVRRDAGRGRSHDRRGPVAAATAGRHEDPVGAEQMIAYTNFFVEDTAYPGVTTTVVNSRRGRVRGVSEGLPRSVQARPTG